MNRFAGSALVFSVACLLGCASAPTTADWDLPAGCVGTLAASYEIRVDGDGQATPACLAIKKGFTEITWDAPGARHLLVLFGTETPPAPKDPPCSGATCKLSRKMTRVEGSGDREFKYSLVLVRADASVVPVDPKLIIKP